MGISSSSHEVKPLYQSKEYMKTTGWVLVKEHLDKRLNRPSDRMGPMSDQRLVWEYQERNPNDPGIMGLTQGFGKMAPPVEYKLNPEEQLYIDKWGSQRWQVAYGVGVASYAGITLAFPRKFNILRFLPGFLPATALFYAARHQIDRQFTEELLQRVDLPLGGVCRSFLEQQYPEHPDLEEFAASQRALS